MTVREVREGLFSFLDSRRYLRQFSPEKQEQMLQQFRDEIGLTDVSLKATAFNDHADKSVNDYTGFKLQVGKTPEDTFDKKLAGTEPGKAEIRDAIASAFKKEPFYEKAQTSYNESIEAFKGLVKKVPHPYTVEGIRGELERIEKRARRAIEAQQKVELKAFETKINEQTDNLKTVLGLDGPKLEKAKADLIDELKKTHEAQLKAFDKTAGDNLIVLDKASALQMERLVFTAQLESFAKQLDAKKRQDMEVAIAGAKDKMRERLQLQQAEGNTGIVDYNNDGMSISAIDPNDLDFIVSLTGKTIKKKENEPGVWTIEWPPRIYDPAYYLGFDQKPKVDLLTAAQAVKASGFSSITMKVTFSDPDTQKKRLRQAYEACLEADFPYTKIENGKEIKHIKLIDGNTGKEVDPKTLFNPTELKLLHDEADARRKKLDDMKKSVPTKAQSEQVTQEMRTELRDNRNKAKPDEEKITEQAEKELEEEIENVFKPT